MESEIGRGTWKYQIDDTDFPYLPNLNPRVTKACRIRNPSRSDIRLFLWELSEQDNGKGWQRNEEGENKDLKKREQTEMGKRKRGEDMKE